jgi:GT2 family glycosyltransferase
MDVSVIIVNYNTKILLENCIKSIYKQTNKLLFEIIVVDNASIDGSTLMIRQNFPKIIVIESDKNLGFGKANNIASRQAKGKYLLLLNSDCILMNNAIFHFYNYFEIHGLKDKIGALGGWLLNEDGNISSSFGRFHSVSSILIQHFFAYFRLIRRNISNEHLSNRKNEVEKIDYVIGADLFIRRNVFIELGMFDERFFMFAEENDLQLRMRKRGYNSFVIPEPKIIHLEGKSTGSNFIRREKMALDSLFKYVKKHNSYFKYKCFRVMFFLLKIPQLILMKQSVSNKRAYFTLLLKSI